MEMLKVNVAMLHTKGKSNFGLVWEDNKMYRYPNDPENPNDLIDNLIFLQHLYLVSDREINPKDTFVDLEDSSIHVNQAPIPVDKSEFRAWKKIEATSDKTLNLPLLPEGFIDVYCEAYNAGKQILQANIVMEEVPAHKVGLMANRQYQPATRKDGTVRVKSLKEEINKEEFWKEYQKFKAGLKKVGGSNKTRSGMFEGLRQFEEWFESKY